MKDTDLQDSGELFDSTPESSDNYVPDTTSDSDSDVSLTLNPTKRQLLDEPQTKHLEQEKNPVQVRTQ